MAARPCAVIFGAGDSGSAAAAIAARLADEGLPLHLAGTHAAGLKAAATALRPSGQAVTIATLDPADATQVASLFQRIADAGQQPSLVVHAPGAQSTGTPALQTSLAEAEALWRRICYAGALIGQAAMPRLLEAGQGTLLLLAPAASGAAVAAASAGLRALSQSMAREFGPQGLHVAQLMLAEGVQPEAVAETCWWLHRQHRTTWTQELDLLP
ncbi:SDR family oxidoreductase [Solimonas sp. K1W22B-7]|uniref:SDR family oxidoreductase n=1 Tax=Solimonas sp. K1W22B-7 TaxID=2303331 RepID=UPI000E334828|nr:SDR family oxidoreductase [Solimonas sp. K1W22B-7]AXQ30181.1 SDR family oxidoreductase [Solimonas sp. K1W22B-7]